MKPEEKYLDQLFDSANAEEPQTSFETVSENFLSATSPTGLAFVKELLFKNFSLNSILLMTVGTVAIFGIWSMSSSSQSISENKISVPAVTTFPIESSVNKNISNVIDKPNVIFDNLKIKNTSLSKNKTEKKLAIQKIEIPISPKIRSVKTFLENNIIITKPKIAIQKQAQVVAKPPKRIIRNSGVPTYTSPWVAKGSGGKTHIDWTIEQSQHVKKVTKHERILQAFLNAEYLKTILEKNDMGDFLPVSIVCNYYFEQMIYLEFEGKQVEISNLNLEGISSFINITKYRVKKKKAYLNFDYKDEKVKMQLKKVNRNWRLYKLKAKNNSGKNIDITF